MTNEALIVALRERRESPRFRIDFKTLQAPPLYACVSEVDLLKTEDALGAKLPAFLRALYLEVGNGGFGPGAGLIGVNGGYPDSEGWTLVDRYINLLRHRWPVDLIPMNDWGDGAWSCADHRNNNVVTAHPTGFTSTKFDVETWYSAWVEGRDLNAEIFETSDRTILNPFTRKPKVVKVRGKAIGDPFRRHGRL
jgi:hypothetical protein